MTKFIEKIIDVSNNEIIERPYTEAEIVEMENAIAAAQTQNATRAEAEATKAAEKTSVLAKLGLTADEVAALLS